MTERNKQTTPMKEAFILGIIADMLEAKQTKERKIIKEEMEEVAALMKNGEFETEMEDFYSKPSIDTSQRKRSRDNTSSIAFLQHTNDIHLFLPRHEHTPVFTKTFVQKKIKFVIFSMSHTPKSYALINLHEHIPTSPVKWC